jgi:hypothetical protein
MNKIQILGMSTDSICILADLFRESGLAEHLDIFMNIEFDEEPITPVVPFTFSIYGPDGMPDPRKKVFLVLLDQKTKWLYTSTMYRMGRSQSKITSHFAIPVRI